MRKKVVPKESKCLTSNCVREQANSRGLCQACYQTAKNLINRNETSWEELLELGMIREKKLRSPFLIAFNTKKQKSGSSTIPMLRKKVSS